ncbi:hypothetical protein SDC9_177144 [bioreactor metagenome]|uniref:Uncharacterized protein n=1 Tax=bioreactor metagenome TaxID=1076179 RepID=A0A645GS67_9ZZZZ
MLDLFFGDIYAVLTTVFVLVMLAFIIIVFIKRRSIEKWGRLILVFVLAGTIISALSAARDAFMMENALFALTSAQALICSVTGGLIYLIGLVSIFVRKQSFRRISFQLISVLFIIQVITIEASRITLI